jgi:hypothetical protein
MNPKTLSEKIITGVLRSPGVTYSRLEEHSTKLGIPIGVFENAMNLVHKNKTIQSKVKGGVLIYVVREAPKPKVNPLAEWRKNSNYPYPVLCQECQGQLCKACFPFYDAENDTIDKIRKRLTMTREEYKALASGRTFIPRKKKYEYKK